MGCKNELKSVDAVALCHVDKVFGPIGVLQDLSLSARKGEILSLLGPSGSGKSTTLRLIIGLLRPDAGEIFIDGLNVTKKRAYERNVGVVFQHYALFPHMTVAQNIAYGLRNRNFYRWQIEARLQEMLALVGLQGHAHKYPGKLSGGEQQRVALARALAPSPSVLLLDEPLSSLDAKLRQELRTELKSIVTSAHCTTILVTHDQEEAMSLSERIAVIEGGRIIQQGSPTELYDRPTNRFVAEFIGRSNWFSGRLERGTLDGTARLATEDGIFVCVQWTGEEGAADVCVRPERMIVTKNGTTIADVNGPLVNRLPGIVTDVAPTGPTVQITVELSARRQVIVLEKYGGRIDFGTGCPVEVQFGSADCIVLPCTDHSVGCGPENQVSIP